MANIAKCARSSEVLSKVNGKNIHAFSMRFAGYNEATEGIMAQQREADRRLKQIQAKKIKTGCNIVNGLRYKEARDSDYHSPRMSVGHKSNAIAKKTFCSTTA